MYNGAMVLRFDDTNPSKEKDSFVENIKSDVQELEIKPKEITFTSNYFDTLQDYMTTMIKKNYCYADNTPPEEMKLQRDDGIPSVNKDNTVEENLEKWNLMIKGEEGSQGWCIRANLDMQNKVKCLRDPVLYRAMADKTVVHQKTGSKYKCYPTYDFACPVVDSLEGITHAIRTIEYRDRNALYYWVQEKLELEH